MSAADDIMGMEALLLRLRAKGYLVQHLKVGEVELHCVDSQMMKSDYRGVSESKHGPSRNALEQLAERHGLNNQQNDDD